MQFFQKEFLFKNGRNDLLRSVIYINKTRFLGVDVVLNEEKLTQVLELARYVASTGCTVRSAAVRFGISKSTVHKDLTVRLRQADKKLFCDVAEVLSKNRAERHIRGGMATRMRYSKATKS